MLKKLIRRWLFNIQRKARQKSLREAIAKAKKITLETDKKVLIYFIQGEYMVMTKQEMKTRWKSKQFIGYTIQEVEKFAELKIQSYDKQRNNKETKQQQKVV